MILFVRLNHAYFSDSPEVVGGCIVGVAIKVILAIESLFIKFKVLFAFLSGDPLSLFEVHCEGTSTTRCTRLAPKDFLLHLLSVDTLNDGAVAL